MRLVEEGDPLPRLGGHRQGSVGYFHEATVVSGLRGLREAVDGGLDETVWKSLASRLTYVSGDYRDLQTYQRLRDALEGTPVRVEFRSDENPFKGKRNPLTPRQRRSKQRMMKRVKKYLSHLNHLPQEKCE